MNRVLAAFTAVVLLASCGGGDPAGEPTPIYIGFREPGVPSPGTRGARPGAGGEPACPAGPTLTGSTPAPASARPGATAPGCGPCGDRSGGTRPVCLRRVRADQHRRVPFGKSG